MGQWPGLWERMAGGSRRVLVGMGPTEGSWKGRQTSKGEATGEEGLSAGLDLVISKTVIIAVPNSVKSSPVTTPLSFHKSDANDRIFQSLKSPAVSDLPTIGPV